MEWLVKLATIKLISNSLLKIGTSCIYLRFLDSSKNHISWSISYLKHNSYSGNNLTTGAILCCLLVLSSHLSCENPIGIVTLRSATNTPQKKPIWPKFVDTHNPKSTSSSFIPIAITTTYQKPHPFKIQIHETSLINLIFNNHHHFQSLYP